MRPARRFVFALALALTATAAAPAWALPRLTLVPALRVAIAPLLASQIASRRRHADLVPHVEPPREPAKHFDLEDAVKEKLGGRVTFFFGSGLTRGDVSGARTFGLKVYFD